MSRIIYIHSTENEKQDASTRLKKAFKGTSVHIESYDYESYTSAFNKSKGEVNAIFFDFADHCNTHEALNHLQNIESIALITAAVVFTENAQEAHKTYLDARQNSTIHIERTEESQEKAIQSIKLINSLD